MRDPDLIVRAQRAATELERAWDRWRTMHGLGTEPLPPVSSYVGYSLEEPWGQPRVVFGMAAREAEQFAALLDRHDCAGPVYAAMTSRSATRPEQDADVIAAGPDRGLVRVPSQAKPATARRTAAHRELGSEPPGADDLLGPPDPPPHRDMAQPGSPAGSPAPGRSADDELPDPAEGQGSGAQETGLVAFRARHEPHPYAADDGDRAPVLDQSAPPAEAGRTSGGWSRNGRPPGSHSLPRQKRSGGSGKGAGGKQEAKDRAGLADLAAELAGWAAGELPGQASHRRAPRPPSRPDRPVLG